MFFNRNKKRIQAVCEKTGHDWVFEYMTKQDAFYMRYYVLKCAKCGAVVKHDQHQVRHNTRINNVVIKAMRRIYPEVFSE